MSVIDFPTTNEGNGRRARRTPFIIAPPKATQPLKGMLFVSLIN